MSHEYFAFEWGGEKTKNGESGHICVFEKNEFEVLVEGAREDVWWMNGGGEGLGIGDGGSGCQRRESGGFQ